MKRWIVSLTLVQILGLLCFNVSSANMTELDTFSINTLAQLSEAELAKKFNSVLDEELSGENVCVTTSAARQLGALMTSSAAKIVREKAFDRVPEAEKNIRTFAKALVAKGTKESGRARITPDTISDIIAASVEPPPSGGPGDTMRNLFCPLFPIC